MGKFVDPLMAADFSAETR